MIHSGILATAQSPKGNCGAVGEKPLKPAPDMGLRGFWRSGCWPVAWKAGRNARKKTPTDAVDLYGVLPGHCVGLRQQ